MFITQAHYSGPPAETTTTTMNLGWSGPSPVSLRTDHTRWRLKATPEARRRGSLHRSRILPFLPSSSLPLYLPGVVVVLLCAFVSGNQVSGTGAGAVNVYGVGSCRVWSRRNLSCDCHGCPSGANSSGCRIGTLVLEWHREPFCGVAVGARTPELSSEPRTSWDSLSVWRAA